MLKKCFMVLKAGTSNTTISPYYFILYYILKVTIIFDFKNVNEKIYMYRKVSLIDGTGSQ